MSVMIAHASKDEKNGIKNGQAGDQTGKEVCIRTWYSRPWNYVLRFLDSATANKVAECMEKAVVNDNIGYDQNQRNTLLNKCRQYGYDVSKVTEPCECDCSSLVSVACMYAGVPEKELIYKGNCATTRTLRNMLLKTGRIVAYNDPAFTKNPNQLRRGDILLSEGHHVAVVVGV